MATAVGGVWWTVTKTDYIPKLVVYLIKMAIPLLGKRKSPEEEALDRQDYRRNTDRHKRPGTGGRNN